MNDRGEHHDRNPMTNSRSIRLLTPVQLGPYSLPNRMVMAPMTRSRAIEGLSRHPSQPPIISSGPRRGSSSPKPPRSRLKAWVI